jgi:acyl carrier protein
VISAELKETILTAIKLVDWDMNDDTLASQVPGWDSLSHVTVLAAVEERFGVHFGMRDVFALKNIGDLQRLIDSKIREKANPHR